MIKKIEEKPIFPQRFISQISFLLIYAIDANGQLLKFLALQKNSGVDKVPNSRFLPMKIIMVREQLTVIFGFSSVLILETISL